MQHLTINLRGQLVDLSHPRVMGIINVTPDSFYTGSRIKGEEAIRKRIEEIVSEGGSFIDVGGYSSRQDAPEVSPQDEINRLKPTLKILRDEYPSLLVSVDTFRADIARMCVEEYGAHMINDISGGDLDPKMYSTVAELGVPYILMHMKGTPKIMQQLCQYRDIALEVLDYFVERVGKLRELDVKDIILDPGYGFAKTLEQNYELMSRQREVCDPLELPVLVGISRKSMIYRLLGCSADDSLNGTSILNTYALLQGAHILRVHDVRQAVEAVRIVSQLQKATTT
ncbi:dihydropteroate synthase [Porphyromonas crevioricanis JCM 15906]|uniref:dihydropteroate synthase n=1 Tax=Porphyromonas crevioricanis JCM 15906 TaxID=1305617 RepID=T1CME3_9PORP|nr:dihydropteroate synthase [Porphyromonas crevioricanis]GAD04902.1 dihydropteroate synthase [Porphyromonas crevioricanis JCM 15906]SJZ73938.1 dihydropteroate synthase [Porphyromonas crevioricanis]